MTHPESIDLAAGSSGWLEASRLLAGMLGLAAILMSAASPAWKVTLTAALCVVLAGRAPGGRPAHTIVRLRLRADGSAIVDTAAGAVQARLVDGGWSSRWCCVVPLAETLGRRRFRALVCASRNSDDAYRRLRVQLRLHAGAEPDHGTGRA